MEKLLYDQFIRRVAYGRNIKKVDSFGSHGGKPFYFYCDHCGIPTEAFPESPVCPPTTCCSQCGVLIGKNILEEAKSLASRFFDYDYE